MPGPFLGAERGPLLLASASAQRRVILESMCTPFEVAPSLLPEPAWRPRLAPARWAEALAYFKARAVAERHPGRQVLGADTLVVCERRILGKPIDRRDAEEMLRLQAGRGAEVITGVCLLTPGRLRRVAHERTVVWMRDSPAERAAYLESGAWAGKAGAYGIQGMDDRLIERVEGCFSNVVGLPSRLVQRLLASV